MNVTKLLISLLAIFFCVINLDSASLDGTTNIVYQSNHYVFSNGDSVTGFVRLDNGFTVPENSSVTFNSDIPVSGGIDLRTTGTLKLQSDLYLDSTVTLSSGGYIYGGDKTIYLGGDLIIPDGTDLIFCFSGVIDGNGFDLILGNWAQILIDSNVTLTLKNLTIKNTMNSLARPAVRCLDWYSKLILDDVAFALNDDFCFGTGQLFIYDDVMFTGTSKFSYRSVLPSYIQPHSLLYFDCDTTFEYYPSTTYNNLINLNDETASIYLNQATLQTTDTGIKLTKGRLFLDNKVTLSSTAKRKLLPLVQLDSKNHGSGVYGASWSRDLRYLAVGGINSSNDLIIYGWDGLTLTQITTKDYGTRAYSVDWNPSGRYLAVGGINAPNDLTIYEWDGLTLNQVVTKNHNGMVRSVNWNPDGKYLAIGGENGSNDLIVYEWDGLNLIQRDVKSHGSNIYDVSWSPDGKYLAVSGVNNPNDLIIYEWNGSTLTQRDSKNHGNYVVGTSWSPNGKYLVVGGNNGSDDLIVYQWDGSLLTQKATQSFGTTVRTIFWSPDGKYFAVGGDNTSSDLVIYGWNGSSLTQIDSIDFGSRVFSVCWSCDGKFLSVGGDNGSDDLIVYSTPYVFDSTSQTFYNSIIFGDSSKGSDYDLDLNILSGARVEVAGKIWDDSAG